MPRTRPWPQTHRFEVLGFEARTTLAAPLYLSPVAAGFPSPADDFVDRRLDLNEFLAPHPSATFFVRARGESMFGAGIHDGDILVVDRSLDPAPGKVVVAALDGELTVKRIRVQGGRLLLAPENPAFRAVEVSEEAGFQVWGVVTHVIHSV